MRIGVTDRSGQVVTALAEHGALAGHGIIALGRPYLDFGDPASVEHTIAAIRPEAVVSAAAYTAVDKAESARDLAFAVNGSVAQAEIMLGVPMAHISTDYVFSGTLDCPYVECDPMGPTGIYGASKLAGKDAVLSIYYGNGTILRVAWDCSPFGGNFVKTMLRLAKDREEISVVADQIGNPTCALDIADGILAVASNMVADSTTEMRGGFHMTAGGEVSWADFGQAIFATSGAESTPSSKVKRITTADYPTPAVWPANSRLNCRRIADVHGAALPDWRDALPPAVTRLLACVA